MKTAVVYHPYKDDARTQRCAYTRAVDGEPCGLPSQNRTHQMPDVGRQTAEERRRLGEREEDE